MRGLTPTLEAAQRSSSAKPYLRVLLHDRDVGALRLRWRRVYSGSEPDGPCAAAVTGDGALLRVRIDPSTGALMRQRVAQPEPTSDFSVWTAVATVAGGPRVGLAANGTRAMIASVRTDGVAVEVRESSDSGATFGAPSTVGVATSAVTAVACSMASDGTAAVLYAAGGIVYGVRRFRTARWRPPGAWSRSLATVNGLAASFEADHNVLVSGTNIDGTAGVWSTTYGAGGAYPPGSWRRLGEVASAAPGTHTTYRASGTVTADVPQLVFVESYAGGGAYDRVHIVAGVGDSLHRDQQWRDPRPFDHRSAYGLAIAAGAAGAWLASPNAVWQAPYPVPETDLTADVLEATMIQGRRGGRFRLLLRNDHARYALDAPPPGLAAGGELRPAPGYVTSAGEESSSGPGFWITKVRHRYEPGGASVEVEAVDGWGLLDAWTAPRQFVWAAGEANASHVLTGVMQRAGVMLTGSGPSLESVTLRPAFTARAGERGSTAARRLLAMLPDDVVMRGHVAYLTEPRADDSAVASFGADDPLVRLTMESGAPATGWARIFGAGVLAEAIHEASLAEGGAAAIVVDENIDAQARADARAETVLRRSQLDLGRGELVVRPHAGLEVGDVVAVTSKQAGLEERRFRASGLHLRYVRGGKRPVYEQRIALSDV
ncbi:MAG: hypothetical protein OXC71_02015 [Chloroflexi bacterium]|nr:hypothetical protein [Chloroflexota bacterium]